MSADNNGHLKFGGFARLLYDITSRHPAELVTYGIDLRRHSTAPKKLSPDKVPALLFQLVEAGYTLRLEATEGLLHVVAATSEEAMDYWRKRIAELEVIEDDKVQP